MGRELVVTSLRVEECWSRLRSSELGRVGITVGALPVILPVFFGVIDESIVFRTSPGTKLAAASSDAVVAFEADAFDPESGEGWSVLVQGVAREATDPELRARMSAQTLRQVSGDGRRDHVVTIAAQIITGRRIQLASLAAPEPKRGSPRSTA
jgi:uncharacterized protein